MKKTFRAERIAKRLRFSIVLVNFKGNKAIIRDKDCKYYLIKLEPLSNLGEISWSEVLNITKLWIPEIQVELKI